ncbi:uncharacterized protein [Asterias amurensis]|uniref:uncharacterized protein n=1 Tax=Asterias amurensis TaxID=7602 RepID=UPI003AB84B62
MAKGDSRRVGWQRVTQGESPFGTTSQAPYKTQPYTHWPSPAFKDCSCQQQPLHSTNKKYTASWARWETWASSKIGMVVFPVNPYQLTLYITELATTGPKSIAKSATAAIKWVHSLVGLPSPTDNPMEKTAPQGFKRLHSSAAIRKEPITPNILSKLMDRHGHKNATLADLRVMFVCLVSYAGFLRFNDLSVVKRNDCKITSDHLTIHLPRSKTDQFRQGSEGVISRTFKSTCPVAVTERYFSALNDPPDSSLPVLGG